MAYSLLCGSLPLLAWLVHSHLDWGHVPPATAPPADADVAYTLKPVWPSYLRLIEETDADGVTQEYDCEAVGQGGV